MRTIIVDDEIWMLEQFEFECGGIPDIELVGKFRTAQSVIDFAKENKIELAFLDVEMPEMNGLELSVELRKLYPGIIIIFVSAYEKYMIDAFKSCKADYYIVKPYSKDDLESAVERARLLSGRMKKRINIRTFGFFDVFLNDQPVSFVDSKAKELLALLVDMRGGVVTEKMANELIWKNDDANNAQKHDSFQTQIKKLEDSLRAVNLEMLVVKNEQGISLRTDLADCDYYMYMDGELKTGNQYYGEYMKGYTWTEESINKLERQRKLFEKYSDSISRNMLFANIKCIYDEPLTLTYMNDSFLTITGYTREEIDLEFHNSLRAMIAREDFDKVNEEIKSQLAVGNNKEVEYRLMCKNGIGLWVMDKGELYHKERDGIEYDEFECILIDISDMKSEQQILEQQVMRDPLTGLFNRTAVETLIETYLKENPQKTCAFAMLDIDNFKQINDTYGHPFADTVIRDVGSIVSRCFRKSDIIGRIGGDEMIVFMKAIPSSEFAMNKIEQMMQRLSARMMKKIRSKEITCSMGVAVYPHDGSNFAELYENADVALYYAKKHGKKQSILFSDVKEDIADITAQREPTAIDYVHNPVYKTYSKNDIITLLESSNNAEDAIYGIMANIGLQYDLSRIYIFENTDDKKYLVNTFEWHSNEVEPRIKKAQPISNELLTPYYQEMKENGDLFYGYDVSALSGDATSMLAADDVKSMLHHILKDETAQFGLIGFDECRTQCYWNGQQIKLLTDLAEILGDYLLTYRKQTSTSLKSLQERAVRNSHA